MEQYAIITENDESPWRDKTGVTYHFPKRYAKIIAPGTQVIYYKGRLRSPQHRADRLSPDSHYFATAIMGEHTPDPDSTKNDYYARITNYRPFLYAVPIRRIEGDYIEPISPTRASNYWRDGVRRIDASIYAEILSLAELEPQTEPTNDLEQDLTSTGTEGAQKKVFSTIYERDPELRRRALEIHGYDCAACGFNFGRTYGEYGEEYIHVHHRKPLAESGGPVTVNPETDLVPVCANCHAIIHRRKAATLSIENIVELIRLNKRQ